MPIYEFKCNKCGKEEDRLVKRSEMDDQLCTCEDGAKMIKMDKIQETSFQLKGNWFKTRKTY